MGVVILMRLERMFNHTKVVLTLTMENENLASRNKPTIQYSSQFVCVSVCVCYHVIFVNT